MEMINLKTWEKMRLEGSGGTNAIANRDLIVKIKDHLKIKNWSVISSCDGSNFGSGDYWTGPSSIINNIAGNNHSWIVLSNPAICPGYQLCIDFANTTVSKLFAYVSIDGVGFEGGTLTHRPVAADEVFVRLQTGDWTSYTSGTTPSANVWTSNDYQVTKIILGPTSIRGIWLFARPVDSPDWWTKPNFNIINRGTCIHGDFSSITEPWCSSNIDGNYVLSTLGTLMAGTSRALTLPSIADGYGDYGKNWPCTPQWIISLNSLFPGILGFVPDQWWLHNNATLQTGDTFPGDDSKQQVLVGNMAFGNNGTDLIL